MMMDAMQVAGIEGARIDRPTRPCVLWITGRMEPDAMTQWQCPAATSSTEMIDGLVDSSASNTAHATRVDR